MYNNILYIYRNNKIEYEIKQQQQNTPYNSLYKLNGIQRLQ